jgi:hypothetical protein
VAALTTAGVAALAAGEAAFGWVPQELATPAPRPGLPLLRVPVAFSFAASPSGRTGSSPATAAWSRCWPATVSWWAAVAAREGAGTDCPLCSISSRQTRGAAWVLTATGRLVAGTAGDPVSRPAGTGPGPI